MSTASAWEIGIPYAAMRLPLPERPAIFVRKLREARGIGSLEVDEESALFGCEAIVELRGIDF